MQLEFSGAAREVTGSCHIVRAAGRTILLDCGMFQGHRLEADAKNRKLPLPVREIDAIVVSHAHQDHTGRLPYLVHQGYAGPIFATPATRDLSISLLADSAKIQEQDAAHLASHGKSAVEPLYTADDAKRVIDKMQTRDLDQWFDVVPGIRAKYIEAGHILGSASITIEADGKRLLFSGDVGRWGLAIIRDPVSPTEPVDLVIMESTYGNRDHDSVAHAQERLGQIVAATAKRGGRVMIPAFALGRAQEIIYDLHALALANKIPHIPIVIDSPLATALTTVFEHHPELYDKTEKMVQLGDDLFRFDGLRFTESVEDSKKLNTSTMPCVIIAGSGMAESGRILHHLMHGASDPRNTIVIVGFQADGTLGRRIVEGQSTIRIFDQHVPLRAQVEVLNGYSAHADRGELQRWLDGIGTKAPVCLVHGEPDAQTALIAQLGQHGYKATAPAPGDVVNLT
ncbi:MAG TPA: MBL fold metallo-hydrolase [Gemmatimonadaceae bacterium]|nr:MBL fold metallo-hydrolase [Gemmatimonadaceae bacterium]